MPFARARAPREGFAGERILIALKILALFSFLIAGWFGGTVMCYRIIARKEALLETCSLLKLLEEEISLRHSNLKDLYESLLDDKFMHLILEENSSFRKLLPPQELSNNEKEWFLQCFSRLGTANASEECKRLAYFSARFEQSLNEVLKQEQKALVLDRKIGLALGGVVALVLW